jgi:hypothetical protein
MFNGGRSENDAELSGSGLFQNKGKDHPMTTLCTHWGQVGVQILLISKPALEVGGQHHAPAALPQIKTGYPLHRRLYFHVVSRDSLGAQTQKTFIRIVRVPAEIRTCYIPNMRHKRYNLRQLVQWQGRNSGRSIRKFKKNHKLVQKVLGAGGTATRICKRCDTVRSSRTSICTL